MRHRPHTLLALLAVLVLAGPVAGPVAAADPNPGPDAWGGSCAVPASPALVASPTTCGPADAGVPTAVIDVDGEVYRIELTAPGALEGAYALATRDSAASIPSGQVVQGDAGPNAPWAWHIDPVTLEWAEVTTEVCDGRPTQIEDGVFTFERFCPWSARLLAIEHDPDAPDFGDEPERPDLLYVAMGGTSAADRTFARRLWLQGGAYTLQWTTDDPLDLTITGCPATIQLLAHDGSLAPGSGSPYPAIQPDDRGELTWADLPDGWYDLFVSIDCGWSIRFGPSTSSAS